MKPEAAQQALANSRERIDELDRQILKLLNERTAVVERIAQIKAEARLPIYEPRREEEVFRNIAQNNGGPLPQDGARRVFERIIDEMRKLQRERMAHSGSDRERDERC